jgi:hypothetical protein
MGELSDYTSAVAYVHRRTPERVGTRLELDSPSSRKQLQQLQVAQFYVLQDLFDALDALREPLGRRRIEVVAGRVVESWWESGAFAMLRGRSLALEAVLRAQQECIDRLAEDEDVSAISPIASLPNEPTWVRRLRVASGLISKGHHEASIPILLQALRALVASAANMPEAKLPTPLAPALLGAEAPLPIAMHVPLLEEAAKRIGLGMSIDPGVAIPLAVEVRARIEQTASRQIPSASMNLIVEESR